MPMQGESGGTERRMAVQRFEHIDILCGLCCAPLVCALHVAMSWPYLQVLRFLSRVAGVMPSGLCFDALLACSPRSGNGPHCLHFKGTTILKGRYMDQLKVAVQY